MVDDIRKLLETYAVKITHESKGRVRFMTIEDSKDLEAPTVTIQFIDDVIYSVVFLDNEFFEIPEQQLIMVLEAILKGEYRVKTSWTKKKSISVPLEDKEITPERVTRRSSKDYNLIPRAFTRERKSP